MSTINKIKTWFFIIPILSCFISCQDYLTIDEVENRAIVDGYYNSTQKIEQALLGSYIDLRRALVINHAWLMYGDVRANDISLDLTYTKQITDNDLLYNNRSIADLRDWSNFYEVIKNANKTLEILEQEQNKVLSSNQYRLFKGEMLAIKSISYFYIFRIWGMVISAEPENIGKQLSKNEVLDLTANWCREAIDLLPWQLLNDDGIISSSLTTVRFNKTAAKLLLSEILLSSDKNEEAFTQLTSLINPIYKDSISSFGLSLGKDQNAQVMKDPYSGMNIGLSKEKFNEIFPNNDKRRSKFNMRSNDAGANLIMDDSKTLTIYPLREIKLLVAESSFKTGNLENAKDLLVEASIGATEDYSLLQANEFLDALLKERQRILIGLGKRFFDLQRFRKLNQYVPLYTENLIQQGADYWPLSKLSLQSNSLTQNTYWAK